VSLWAGRDLGSSPRRARESCDRPGTAQSRPHVVQGLPRPLEVGAASSHTTRRETNLGGNDETRRPEPVEVPLDDNASPRRRAAERAGAPRLATRRNTIRRTIVILAVGAIGGASLSQGLAHPNQSTAPTSTTTAPVVPAEQLQEELTEAARPSGDTVTDLIAGLDAITQVQIAHAASTDGTRRADVMRLLRQQHDDVRNLILTYYYGWLPYPNAVTPPTRFASINVTHRADVRSLAPAFQASRPGPPRHLASRTLHGTRSTGSGLPWRNSWPPDFGGGDGGGGHQLGDLADGHGAETVVVEVLGHAGAATWRAHQA
jgi:hypothetical protein